MLVTTPKPITKEGASAITNAVDVVDADSNVDTTSDTLSFTPVDAHKTKSHWKRQRLEIIDDQKTNND